jgi:hypothetical protein
MPAQVKSCLEVVGYLIVYTKLPFFAQRHNKMLVHAGIRPTPGTGISQSTHGQWSKRSLMSID